MLTHLWEKGRKIIKKRCINSVEIPCFSKIKIEEMCECLADNSELRWYDLVNSVKQTDSPYELQQKSNNMMKEITEECYMKIK